MLWLVTPSALFICIPVSFTVYTTSTFPPAESSSVILTLSGLSLRDPLSDYPTGIIDGCGGLKLHRLHNVALANADFQRQHHHLGRLRGQGLQLHLQGGEEGSRRGELIARCESRRATVIDGEKCADPGGQEWLFCCHGEGTYIALSV